MNIESEHINAASRTKNYHSALIFLCFRQYLDKKLGKSCPELSVKLPLGANHCSASDWPSNSAHGRVYTEGHLDIDLLKVVAKTVHDKKA